MPNEMELEKKTFPTGQHRNKTYLYVFENEKEYIQSLINGEASSIVPQDFLEFLRIKMDEFTSPPSPSVAEQDRKIFFKTFPSELKLQRFKRVIGEISINLKQIHPPTTIQISNGFLGVFYRYFFVQKHIANISNTDGNCRYLNNYASIFPFPVSDELKQCDIDILEVIDDKLLDDMQKFFDEHFDAVEIRSICRKFLVNILNCKEKNVPEKAIVEAVKDLNLKGLPANNGGDKNVNDDEECEYLKSYPRVNDSGVRRYRMMYDMIVDVTKLYDKPCNVEAFKYERDYLLKLPEINFYELYSLLNVEFLRSDRSEYVYRFKKYVFFFINALNHPSKPVFFIDDGLYECLRHYNTFKKSRTDVEMLKFELSMLSLAYRRKQQCDGTRGNLSLDDENLRNVKTYFEGFSDIVQGSVTDEICPDKVACEALVSTERIAIDVCFRAKRRNFIANFYTLIIYAALSPKSINRLVMYNAFTGEETSISMPSRNTILQFIRKYGCHKWKYDDTQHWLEEFFTPGPEFYYQGDIKNWDSKKNFNF